MIYIVAAGILLITGDITLKYWVMSDNKILYFAGLLQYFSAMVLLVESYKTQNIVVASIVMTLLNEAVVTIILWKMFNESLSVKQFIGVVLAVFVIYLLEF